MHIYFETTKKEAFEKGYILINDITNRKSYYDNFDLMLYNYKKLEAFTEPYKNLKFRDRGKFRGLSSKFWNLWSSEWKHGEDAQSVRIRSLFKTTNNMLNIFERKSLNYPCQGTAADMTKLALIKVYDWILDNNYFHIIKIANAVHDEIVLEAPEHLAQQTAKVLIKSMEDAGSIFCKTIPITADVEIGKHWIH